MWFCLRCSGLPSALMLWTLFIPTCARTSASPTLSVNWPVSVLNTVEMSIQWCSTSKSLFLTPDYVGSSEVFVCLWCILPRHDMIWYNSKMCRFRSPDQCWVLGNRKSRGPYPPCAWWWHPSLRTGCFRKCIQNCRNIYLKNVSDLDYKRPLLWWCNLRLTLRTATVACCLMLAWKVDEY